MIVVISFLLCVLLSLQCVAYKGQKCEFIFTLEQCMFDRCIYNLSGLYLNETVSWRQCLSYCCSNFVDPNSPDNINSLSTCQPFQQDSSSETVILVAFLAGLITFVLIVFFLYCFGLSKIKDCLQTKQLSQNKSELIMSNSSEIDDKDKLKIMAILRSSQSQNQPQSCSICKQNNTNIRTLCTHQFHLSCIYLWSLEHQDCPQCCTRLQGQFLFYCVCCRKYSKLSSIPQTYQKCVDCSAKQNNQIEQ